MTFYEIVQLKIRGADREVCRPSIEVKDPSRIESNDVQRKRRAAEIWCKQRNMEYIIATAN